MSTRIATSAVVMLRLVLGRPGNAQDVTVGGKLGFANSSFGGDADWDSKTGFAVAALPSY